MNSDDPKFTAYALGEVDDLTPEERAEIEALLACDAQAAAEAAEMRALAGRLRVELPGEAAGALRPDQRATVLNAGAQAAPKVIRFPRRALWWSVAAACVAVSASVALLLPPHREEQSAAAQVSATELTKSPALLTDLEVTPRPPAIAPNSETVGILVASATPGAAASSVSIPNGAANLSSGVLSAPMTWTEDASKAAPERSIITTSGSKSEIASTRQRDGISQTQSFALATDQPILERPISGPKAGRDDEREGKLQRGVNTERFDAVAENDFLTVAQNPLSTFSIDVDTASYSIVRRFLTQNQRPPRGAVRLEELLNYFTYDYAPPQGDVPFSAAMEATACPWNPEHRLVRIGLKGREIPKDKRPASNLVFLIDVSGSMQPQNKLPLLQRSLGLLVDQLGGEDRVAIVVYAGSSGCVLEPTSDKSEIRAALERLQAGGSTNGASGLQLAYELAKKSFIKGGTNRVILATDGDWNVGVTTQSDLLDLIAQQAKSGVFLTVLGFGMGNLNDSMMVKLAGRGNGNYAYLDTLAEAKKVLVEQLSGTLVTIAKDVKIQVEFNPAKVAAYRLIGYEKRVLTKEDFNDDKKDAGEIGAGHTVTALYEVVPVGKSLLALAKAVDQLKYQPTPGATRLLDRDQTPQDPKPAAPLPPAGRAIRADKSAGQSTSDVPIPNPVPIERFKATDSAELQKSLAGSESLALQSAGKADAVSGTIAGASALPAVMPKAKQMAAVAAEMLTLKLRYKEPEGDTSKLLEFPLTDAGALWEQSSRDLRFAAAVAGFGMMLRDSAHKGDMTWDAVAEWAQEGLGADANGYRAEFITLIEKAKAVTR